MNELRNNEAQPRVITAMVTPFHENGRLNVEAAQTLANFLVNNGSDGLVLAGTTGESPTLLAQDQLLLFDVVREAVGSEVLLMGGTGSNSNSEAVNMTREADRRHSVDAFLVVSPYYNRPSQYGIEGYFRDVSSSTDLPTVLYNIPVRTGRAVELETINRLVADGVVQGLKDATGNTDMATELNRRYGRDLTIYSGDDSLNLEFARAGAVGAISVASHWAGKLMGRMFEAYFSDNQQLAGRIEAALGPSCEFESTHTDSDGVYHDTPNPIPTKVMMSQLLGSSVIGECLPPMAASEEDMNYLRRRACQIIQQLNEEERYLWTF